MQLTSPAFLFLFLPLSLFILFVTPKANRRICLSLISVCWYLLANQGNLSGLTHIASLVAFSVLLAYLPTSSTIRRAKIRTAIWVAVPLLSFVAARILAEYGFEGYRYPVGLLFVTLACISFAIDQARGDTVRPRNALELIGYLLFFPVLTMGPVLRSKVYFDMTEELGFHSDAFYFGIRKLMLGCIKRLAFSAVALRAFSEATSYIRTQMHPVTLLILLILSLLGFYYAVGGTVDMARGVCAMYGIWLPRDRARLAMGTSPDRIFYGILLSLRAYLLDYLILPIERRLGGKRGRVVSVVLLFFCIVLLWRTRLVALLFALPLLFFALLNLSPRVRKAAYKSTSLRLLSVGASLLLCAPLTLVLTMQDPMYVLELISSAFQSVGHYPFYAVFGVIRDAWYLVLLGVLLLLLLPYAYICKWLRRKSGPKMKSALALTEITVIFAGFLATLIYFAPQFPQYAIYAMYLM